MNSHLSMHRLCLTLFFLTIVGSRANPSLPQGFSASTVVENLNAAAALAVTPDGRVFVAEQTGKIRVLRQGKLLSTPAIDLGERLDTWWERGLIGLTFHPDFPSSPYIYLVYVAKEPFTHHVVSRFTVVGDLLDPGSEQILLKGDNQKKLGKKIPGGHQGGPICFGKDGMLYIGIGDHVAGKPAQALDTLQGKILRIQPDGRIPQDNPYYGKTEGKYRSIYAIGLRNPFGLAVDPASGKLFETDVGGSAFDEINHIKPGGNYGWPQAEGKSTRKGLENPIHAYPPAIGRSICGGMFYPQTGNFPAKWKGKFFFVDWAAHWVKAIDPEDPGKLIPFGKGFAAPVGIAPGPDGSLYVLNRNTRWRDGKKFKENSGSLVHIRYDKNAVPAQSPFPKRISETGVLESAVPPPSRQTIPALSCQSSAVAPWSHVGALDLCAEGERRSVSLPAGSGRSRRAPKFSKSSQPPTGNHTRPTFL